MLNINNARVNCKSKSVACKDVIVKNNYNCVWELCLPVAISALPVHLAAANR